MRDRAKQWMVLALLGAGCGDPSAPPYDADSGPDVDDPGDPLGDTDRDGLCNGTETDRGLDPAMGDTDGDGFPDLVEVLLGFEADRPASPERDRVLLLEDRAGASAVATVLADVDAGGEDFDGAFDALPGVESRPTAGDFYEGARAIAARPGAHAAVVEAENERFRGVTGETQLQFELSFRHHEMLLGCAALYPFRYLVKRSDGVVVAAPRFALFVSPDGAEPADAMWCMPDLGGCF